MTPKQITDALERFVGPLGQAHQLRDVIETVLLSDFKQPPTVAAEKSEKLASKVADEIQSRSSTAVGSGSFSTLTLHSNQTSLCGSLLVLPTDDDETALAKRNRGQAHTLFDQIRALHFSKFERFGEAILRELGCTSPEITRHSNDQGIDFYGEVSIGDLLGMQPSRFHLMHASKTVIVGQAKHYPSRSIGPATVRELVGALSLARTSSYSKPKIDLLDKVDLRPFTPALAMLISTGEFTTGARHLAKEAGILLFSGWQLSVFLADCKVGMKATADGFLFDDPTFRTWLDPNQTD